MSIVRRNTDDPTRPLELQHDGWRVSVATMDGYHLRTRASWRRQLAMSHPDHTAKEGSARKFCDTMEKYRRWLNEERVRYGKLGLTPPRRA